MHILLFLISFFRGTMSTTELTAAIIADIFNVSRSAVSQTCKTNGVEEDFKKRVIRYLDTDEFFRTKNDMLIHIDLKTTKLCNTTVSTIEARNQEGITKSKGRPFSTTDSAVLVEKIKSVVADYKKSKNL